jgi:MFS family permease
MRLPAPRTLGRAFHSLKTRNYRLFWFGQLISLTGTWMQDTALSWLILNLPGLEKPSVVFGTAMAVRFLPILLFALPSGVLADRMRKRRVLIATQSTQMVVALVLGVLVSTGSITIPLIYALAALRGFLDTIDGPARQSFVQEMVGGDDLPNGVALNATLFNSCRMFGPVVAAVVIKFAGIAPCFYINAASFIAVVAALAAMRTSELHILPRAPREGVWTQMHEGLRYVRHTGWLIVIFTVMAALGTFGYNFQTTIPLIAKFQHAGSATTLALLLAFSGAGSVLAGLVAAYRSKPSQGLLLGSAVCFTVLLELVGISPWPWLTMVLLLMAGFTGVLCMTSANTLVQLGVPGNLRGRVMGIYMLLFVGTTPIGSYLCGQLALLGGGLSTGVRMMVLITAGLTGVGILAALSYSLRSRGEAAPPLDSDLENTRGAA